MALYYNVNQIFDRTMLQDLE